MPIFKKVNKKFFKKWTPEMAYVLGFFAADGYMTVNKRGACFWSIQINDRRLLEEIRRAVNSEHKISVKIKKKIWKISYRLQIGSKDMYEDLYQLGMRQDKTKSLAVPKVPDDLFCHFIRGYFDGDGNVWVGLVHKERKTPTLVIRIVFTSCSKKFLEEIKKRLEHKEICRGVLSQGNGNYYRLVYSIQGSLKMYDFMYNKLCSSKLFLNRKKRIFENYVKMRV